MTRPAHSQLVGFLRDLLAIALLWVLVLAFFWRVALAGRVLAGGDIFTYFYPYWAEATRALQAGRLPLWNPYLFMGAPFLANSQAGVFYPLNWPLWLLLPAHQSVHLTVVLHLCLAALNAYLWGRGSLRLGRLGAWTVGVTFALGGYLGAQVEHVNQLQGLAWLPLILALYDKSLHPNRKSQIGKSANHQITNPQTRNPQSAFSILHSPFSIALSIVLALVLLAGHTQTAFISLVGLSAYGLGPALWRGVREREWGPLAQRVVHLVVVTGLGVVLAAVQLLPTWELSRLSIRARGLPFNERVSFSLSPSYLARAFLPGFADPVPPEHIEHVAYVGIAALSLAAFSLPRWRHGTRNTEHGTRNTQHGTRNTQHATRHSVALLLTLGLLLSLGLYNPLYLLLARLVPGFAHFRVPARWLVLTVTGLAALAGWGAEALYHRHRRVTWRTCALLALALVLLGVWAVVGGYGAEGERVARLTVVGWAAAGMSAVGLLLAAVRLPRLATVGLLALLVVELWAAGLALPYSRATASQALTGLRPAIAHLLVAEEEARGPAPRFISMSDITFDPGDLAEIEVIYGPQLSTTALYDLIVAAKHKEVLSPNLPLAFGVPAVDGYDGGVLPLARYVALQRLFLPADQVSMDGRLRENLAAIPDGRWLNLFDVRYVITDKLYDAWLDDVFYDLQWGAELGPGQVAAVAHVPRFEATALGVVSYLRGVVALPNGAPVGVVEVGLGAGITRTFELRAGEHTAEGLYSPQVTHAQAPAGGHFWPGQPEGNDYVARLRWPQPAVPTAVVVRATLPQGALIVRGVSLIDERTGGFQSLVLSDRGRFRLAHSGDVKIYENLDVLGRAFLVHQATVAPNDEAALARMQDPAFDPAAEVVLSEEVGLPNDVEARIEGVESARVVEYAPERVEVEIAARTPAYLVLSDAWYPGWKVTIDGAPVALYRADLLFRAVAVPAGTHRVLFTFRPASLYIGAGISLVGLMGLVVAAGFALPKARRNAIMGIEHVEHSEEGKR